MQGCTCLWVQGSFPPALAQSITSARHQRSAVPLGPYTPSCGRLPGLLLVPRLGTPLNQAPSCRLAVKPAASPLPRDVASSSWGLRGLAPCTSIPSLLPAFSPWLSMMPSCKSFTGSPGWSSTGEFYEQHLLLWKHCFPRHPQSSALLNCWAPPTLPPSHFTPLAGHSLADWLSQGPAVLSCATAC